MRAVIQRVSEARVVVNGTITGAIGPGLLVLLGIEAADGDEDIVWLSHKIVQLRIFNAQAGLMNCSLQETGGGILVISQFTLHAAIKKGARPSYIRAAKGEIAQPLYEKLLAQLERISGQHVEAGVFGADMKVHLVNDGPVTLFIDTKNKE